MILVRTPLRITLGGGGTDLPSYYSKMGGYVISAAISKYTYVSISEPFTDDILLKYSENEKPSDISSIKHPIIQAVLTKFLPKIKKIEIASFADVSQGTGLGSSGSFTNSLIKAIHCFKREYLSNENLAKNSCDIEIIDLGRPVGKQDQYATSIGGISEQTYHKNGDVSIESLPIARNNSELLNERLLLFFTNTTRSASSILKDQHEKSLANDKTMLENLNATKKSGKLIREILLAGDYHQLGSIMHDHWLRKKERSKGMSSPVIDEAYNEGLKNGAIGGKVVGAGGGGFLMFVANDPHKLRTKMSQLGLPELNFNFEFEGSTVLINT